MGTILFFVLGAFVVFVLTNVLVQLLGRYVYSYRLSERGVDFRLFGLILFWRIPFRDIVDARQVRAGKFFVRETGFSLSDFRLLRFGNRVWVGA